MQQLILQVETPPQQTSQRMTRTTAKTNLKDVAAPETNDDDSTANIKATGGLGGLAKSVSAATLR